VNGRQKTLPFCPIRIAAALIVKNGAYMSVLDYLEGEKQ
jgi:hypothetical protein